MSTRGYTESHFAAALFACGPHVRRYSQAVIASDNVPDVRVSNDYRDRVYKYFFEMFPDYYHVPPGVRQGAGHEWSVFWREYTKWVEK